MNDAKKPKTQLLHELAALRQRVAALEAAQTARQQTETIEQQLVESIPDALVIVDKDGTIVMVNSQTEQLFGYTRAEMLGSPVEMLLPARFRATHLAHRERYGTNPQVRPMGTGRALYGRRNDSQEFLVDISLGPLETPTGTLVVSVIRDITARTQAAMQHANRLALVGQLASGLAHEIGTPLNIIVGTADLLRLELGDLGIERAEFATIVEQTERITRLIDQLLTFARSPNRAMEPLLLEEPLSQVLRLLELPFKRATITPMVEVPADLPLVWAAGDQLEQVFLNLLVNAWHAMPGGGTVTIEAREADEQQVQITFRDTGCGMASADLARAFEPFYSTKGTQGTGLGLAMCKQIIEHHQGTIHLDSTPGDGTTVTMALRRADAV